MNRVLTAVTQPLETGQSGVRRGGRQGVPDVPDDLSPFDVPMCSHGQGSIRAASGTTLGVPGASKMKKNERFYGFTDLRGKMAERGRGGHATANQVTAGKTGDGAGHGVLMVWLPCTRV